METNMTQGSPLKLILHFMLPLLIGNIFQQFYNMADTIIVGHFVGSKALAAVGSTGTIMFLVIGISTGMATGFTVLTSQKYGAGDFDGTKQSVSNGILLSAVMAVVMTVLSLLVMHPLLALMNTPSDIYNDAYSYISVICIGTAASIYYNLFSAYMRAVGNSRVPVYFLVFSALLNIVLDLVFVINFKMGTAGAAWATDLSQAISAVLCLIYIYRKMPNLRPEAYHWRLNRAYTKHQLEIGLPMAVQFGITASGTMIMQAAINMFGSTAVAGFTAACKVQNILTQGMISIGQTMAAYSGQNYGKMDLARIRKGTNAAMKISFIYSVAAGIIACLSLKYLMRLFFSADVDMASLLPWAKTYIYECAVFYIPLCMIFIYRNTIQGCGYGGLAMLLGFTELGARLITAVFAMKFKSYPLTAGCDAAAWFVTGIESLGLFYIVMKDIKKRGYTKAIT